MDPMPEGQPPPPGETTGRAWHAAHLRAPLGGRLAMTLGRESRDRISAAFTSVEDVVYIGLRRLVLIDVDAVVSPLIRW